MVIYYIEKGDGTVAEVDFDRRSFPVEILRTFVDENTGEVVYEVNMYAKEEEGSDGNVVFKADGSSILRRIGEKRDWPPLERQSESS